MNEQHDGFIIPKGLAQAVLDYLGTKPYNEVATLIYGMLSLKPCKTLNDTEIPNKINNIEKEKSEKEA